jgi:glycosyltransferase involved in cell wall biosynthesis
MAHVIIVAYGFPPAAKSGTPRLRAMANAFASHGWDVTAVSLADGAWHREMGLDHSGLEGLHPGIERVGLAIAREDMDPDLRAWTQERAEDPDAWRSAHRAASKELFPEEPFGAWRHDLEAGVAAVHARKPADLLVVSPMPYVTLAVAQHLHERFGVPYIVDYRDGWCFTPITGEAAFSVGSPEDIIERSVIAAASEAWFVNDAILEYYAERYPESAEKFRVVRNGYDEGQGLALARTGPSRPPLTFGYLGNVTSTVDELRDILDAWRIARQEEPLLAGARLEFRGHLGAGFAAGANAQADLIASRLEDGVDYLGPVPRADLGEVYGAWDGLLLAVRGGRYVTGAKVYEYMATGLPIVSAHTPDHDASLVLEGYPLWSRVTAVTPAALAAGFVEGARMAVAADEGLRQLAREHGERYERGRLLEPALSAAARCAREPRDLDALADVDLAPLSRRLVLPRLERAPTSILLLAGTKISPIALQQALPQLRATGAQVRLATRWDAAEAVAGEDLVWRKVAPHVSKVLQRLSPTWWRRIEARRVAARIKTRHSAAEALWQLIQRDNIARPWLAEADLVVALDRYAALTAWRVMQERPEVVAVLGLAEALRLVRELESTG